VTPETRVPSRRNIGSLIRREGELNFDLLAKEFPQLDEEAINKILLDVNSYG
jgi:hypothetical protein